MFPWNMVAENDLAALSGMIGNCFMASLSPGKLAVMGWHSLDPLPTVPIHSPFISCLAAGTDSAQALAVQVATPGGGWEPYKAACGEL